MNMFSGLTGNRTQSPNGNAPQKGSNIRHHLIPLCLYLLGVLAVAVLTWVLTISDLLVSSAIKDAVKAKPNVTRIGVKQT